MGGVLGAVDTFNSEVEDSDLLVTYTATVPSGTVLKLKFQDFYHIKYGYQTLVDDEASQLTPEEQTIRMVQREGYKRLSSNMNQFLRKCNIIPSIGNDASAKYICEGSRGRTIDVARKQNEVLFLLQGEVKVVLEKSIITALKEENDRLNESKNDDTSDEDEVVTNSREGGSISMRKPGEPSMTISMSQIPLAVLEAGSILLFDEDMFSTVSTNPSSGLHSSSAAHPSIATPLQNSSASAEHEEHEPEEPVGLPPLPDPQSRKERENGKNVVSYVNHMSIIFEKPTVYLSVPLKRIKNCLQGESYQSNLGIRF